MSSSQPVWLAKWPTPKEADATSASLFRVFYVKGQRIAGLCLQLLPDRQRTDALAGSGEDRVYQRWSKGRQTGLADTTGRLVSLRRHDVDVGDQRRFIDTHDRETVEIALLHPAVLEADLAVLGEAKPHDRRTLDLRLDPLGIDERSAIDRGIDTFDPEFALVTDRYLDNGRDVADEAAVRGDAKPVALRHLATPATLVRHQFDDAAQPAGIDRVAFQRLAVVPEFLH